MLPPSSPTQSMAPSQAMPLLLPAVKGAVSDCNTLPEIGSMTKMLGVGGLYQEAIQRLVPSNVRSRTLELGAVMVRTLTPWYGSYCSS